jgi:hypothetical protein
MKHPGEQQLLAMVTVGSWASKVFEQHNSKRQK